MLLKRTKLSIKANVLDMKSKDLYTFTFFIGINYIYLHKINY
jgi:hypothetical protein